MARMQLFLKEWREFRKLTQAQLGQRVGVEGPTISRWETGSMNWKSDRLGDLADALDLDDVADLFRDPNRPLTRVLQLVEVVGEARAVRVLEAVQGQGNDKPPLPSPDATPRPRKRRKAA